MSESPKPWGYERRVWTSAGSGSIFGLAQHQSRQLLLLRWYPQPDSVHEPGEHPASAQCRRLEANMNNTYVEEKEQVLTRNLHL